MQQRKYLLLLHDAVRSHIASLGSRQRERLREKLEFLRHGMWDAGVRVKKLKGGRSSFEARLTRGDRILFTLGRPPETDSPGGTVRGADATRIYVWGVVKHDDVTATERRIVAANAPFLDFRPDEVEQLSELVLDDLPDELIGEPFERPYSTPPNHDSAYRTSSYPNGDVPDAAPQRWLVVDDEEWRRLLETEDPESVRLYLFLTGEQARLLHSEPPVLLSGTAGSGKTTIAVYYLLRHRACQLTGNAIDASHATGDGYTRQHDTHANAHAAISASAREHALFVTGSPHLKRFSERLYRGLVAETDLERVPNTHFATFTELLDEILPANLRTSTEPPTGLREFHAIFHNHPSAARYDTELVWEEIRSIIKGANPPVSRRRFEELTNRLASSQVTMRERAELAEYLVRLRNLELNAKLDVIRERKTSFSSLQEFITGVRDASTSRHAEKMFMLEATLRLLEGQADRLDQPLLTLKEYESLGRKRAPNFPFDRRDIYQIAEYYQKRLEQTARMDEIDLARAALRRLEQQEDRYRYDLVVCDEVQDFTDIQIALLFRLAADPLHTVLAGDPKQIINPSGFRWEEVRARYYERGMRVPEVVNLSVNFRSVGNIVELANGLLDLKRSLVGLASGEIAERWTFRGRPPLLVDGLTEPEMLAEMRQPSAGQMILVRTPEECHRLRTAMQTELVFTINDAKGLEFDRVLLWRFAGSSGSETRWRRIAHKHHLDAAETPRIRHEINLLYVAVTRARNTLVIWDGTETGPVWTVDQLERHVLRSGDANALRTVWQHVSSPAEWESQGDYFFDREHFAAAEECYRNAAAHTKEALACAHQLEQSGNYHSAADLFSTHGQFERAAKNLEHGNALKEAARAWRRAGDDRRALTCDARHFEKARRYVKAAACWKKLGDTERMLENWERAGEHQLMADHYISLNKHGKAAYHLKLHGDHAQAALHYRRAGMIDYAAAEFETDGQYDIAAPLYRRLGDEEALLRCVLELEDHHEAATMYEKINNLEQAVECFRKYVGCSDDNRLDLERRLEEIDAKQLGISRAVRLAGLGRNQEAAEILDRHGGHLPQTIALYQEAKNYAAAAACLARGSYFLEAAREIALAGTPESLRQAVEYLGEYMLAAWDQRQERTAQLTRSARRLSAAGEHERSLAHWLALQSVPGERAETTVVDETCQEYCLLEHHEEALRYFLDQTRVKHAIVYLDARPDLVLPLDAVETMARGQGPQVTLWTLPNDHLEIVLRLLHGCLHRGGEADRQDRVTAILATLPKQYGVASPLYDELGEMLIELRLINPIVSLLSVIWDSSIDDRYSAFLDRLRKAGDQNTDREMQLCMRLLEPELLDEGLNDLPLTELNCMLFAYSPNRYTEAITMLQRLGDDEEAISTCRRHGDDQLAEKLLQKTSKKVSKQ